ncbi:MAG: hypothetical protein L6R40_004687 [Gallowayella cf. fulva]|nr:MAG: hypothetical protein L6R40_004687 [Xanthomendoza cf. fulva]
MVGLVLDSAPFRPSLLRNDYTPRSPASPLQSVAKRVCYTSSTELSDSSSASSSSIHSSPSLPPRSPEKWIWQCHECRTGYQIGITRRCLLDGHELCYGQPVQKRSKKGKKKVRSCQSQFDYIGWQEWGAWKRTQLGHNGPTNGNGERNCSDLCDWPSQCRWSRQQSEQAEQAEQTCTNHVPEAAALRAPESVTTPTIEESATDTPTSSDSLISKIGTATQKLTSQWTSMLSPIEEEPALPNMTAIEEFLNSAKTKTEPTIASERIDVPRHDSSTTHGGVRCVVPLEIVKTAGRKTLTVAERPRPESAKAEAKFNVFGLGLDFDFGFQQKAEEGGAAVPSLSEGLKDLVAGTIGIALSTPARGRRCISAPPTRSMPLQDQIPGARRRSVN